MNIKTSSFLKSVLSLVLCLVIASAAAVPTCAADVSIADQVSYILRSQIVYDDFYKLAVTVDDGDPAKMFQTVLEIYPDLIAAAKKAKADISLSSASGAENGADRYGDAVRAMLRSQVVFDDLGKLCEAVNSNDSERTFRCILEIYPDFIAALKKELAESPSLSVTKPHINDSPNGTSSQSSGDVWYYVLTAIGGAAVGAAAAGFVFGRKKKQSGAAKI